MPNFTFQTKLESLLLQYQAKNLAAKEVRDALVRDIMALLTLEEKGGKKSATVMTEGASIYNPKDVNSIPQRPKSV